jgi:lipocalin
MKQQLNEVARFQKLAGIIAEGYMGTSYSSSEDMAVDMLNKGIKEEPAPGEKQTGDAPMTNNKKNDFSKINWNPAGMEKYEKNKKKYSLRIVINDKPKVFAFADSPVSEKEAKNLLANYRNSTWGQGVIGPEGAKVEFQVVDTASDKAINSYKMDVARDPSYAGWGHSSTHGTV